MYAVCSLAGNSCTPPGTPAEYAAPGLAYCGKDVAYPEEFWNCADIRIAGNGPASPAPPSPPPSPPPPPARPPSPSPPSPKPQPPSPPASATFACTGKVDGMYSDPKNCSKYYQCASGATHSLSCPPTLYFNAAQGYCDYPSNVICNVVATPSTPPPPTAASSPPPSPVVSKSPPPPTPVVKSSPPPPVVSKSPPPPSPVVKSSPPPI
jgi:hypothetical protein